MLRLRLPLIFALLTLGALQTAAAASLNVFDAWLRVPPPGADIASVYFTVRNVSQHSISIEGAEAGAASMAMLHESRIVNGKAEMRMLDNVILAPGQSVSFAPNGKHLMLHGLNRRLLIGEKLPVVLLLSGGEKIAFTAAVRPLTD